MYWEDYYESTDYAQADDVYHLKAIYSFGENRKEFDLLVGRASEAPAIFRAWRKEFKESLKTPAIEQVVE